MIPEWFQMNLRQLETTIFEAGKLKPKYLLKIIFILSKSKIFIYNKYSFFEKSRMFIPKNIHIFKIQNIHSEKLFISLKFRIFIQKNYSFFQNPPYSFKENIHFSKIGRIAHPNDLVRICVPETGPFHQLLFNFH